MTPDTLIDESGNVPDEVFNRTVDSLHNYAEIYRNFNTGALTPSLEKAVAFSKLEELIIDRINFLYDNAKGQV